jgi:hypothetical protein
MSDWPDRSEARTLPVPHIVGSEMASIPKSCMQIVLMCFVIAAVGLSGCASDIVSHAVRNDRLNFNEVIVQSWNEQLLLNLVRLRYRDNPLFLEMGTVITGYSLKGASALTGGTTFQSPLTGDWKLSLGGEYTTTPTLTYYPLQGEDYATRLLSPISPSIILFLSQSGWSIERLLTICVQQANEVPNAVTAAGPTPDDPPVYEKAQRLFEAMRVLQKKGLLETALDRDGKTVLLYIRPTSESVSDSSAATVRMLLDLDPQATSYRLVPSYVRERTDEIAMMGRSLLSVMYFLSHGIEVPVRDAGAGKVRVTRTSDGKPFDWNLVIGKVFRVRVSPLEPADAYVRVFYRDAWFYIADSDLNSKATFNLLTLLFNLKAAGKGAPEPFMSYPVR